MGSLWSFRCKQSSWSVQKVCIICNFAQGLGIFESELNGSDPFTVYSKLSVLWIFLSNLWAEDNGYRFRCKIKIFMGFISNIILQFDQMWHPLFLNSKEVVIKPKIIQSQIHTIPFSHFPVSIFSVPINWGNETVHIIPIPTGFVFL